jgi:hypothetical protein
VILLWIFFKSASKASKNSQRATRSVALPDNYFGRWSIDDLKKSAENVFKTYQANWSEFQTDMMTHYMTPNYHDYAEVMMLALRQMGRANVVNHVDVTSVSIVGLTIGEDGEVATMRAEIRGRVLDTIMDTVTGETLDFNPMDFMETYKFVVTPDMILLDGIDQPTVSQNHLMKSLEDFAAQNKMFYTPDWGRLLLPRRGLAFRKASFKVSDINNHVIGQWGDSSVVQVYTYTANPNITVNGQARYLLIGQLSIPRSYDGIIVKPRKMFARRPPKEYEQYQTEWEELNSRYEMWATARDKVTSFELLNPDYMAKLYDSGLKEATLEVVDNVIYISTPTTLAPENYAKILELLRLAYHEMKL